MGAIATMLANQMGPPAPKDYPPTQMIGQQEEPDHGLSYKDMLPMFIAQLADLGSTEAVRLTRGAHEDDPLVRKLQIGGSNAPAMIGGAALEALLLHTLGNSHPGLARTIAGANTSMRGSAAGSNLSIATGRDNTDHRLSTWMNK